MSIIGQNFTNPYDSKFFETVSSSLCASVFYEKLIKEYIRTYVKYNTEEQFKYVYDKIVKEFNYYLKRKKYNLKKLESKISVFILSGFIKNYCTNFSFEEKSKRTR